MIATPPRRAGPQVSRLPTEKPRPLFYRPRTALAPEGDRLIRPPRSLFWTWVVIVALLHFSLLLGLILLGNGEPKRSTPEFISLLPAGDLVRGSPGVSQAQRQPLTPAAQTAPADPPPSDSEPLAPMPAEVKTTRQATKRAIEQETAPNPLLPPKVHLPPEPRPPKPAKPKIKVSLTEITRPLASGSSATEKPSTSKLVHSKKSSAHSSVPTETQNPSLSREQIAAALGQKLAAEGVTTADKLGPSGAADGRASSFAPFYASVRDQVMNNWEHPEMADSRATPPIVRIHVDSQNHVPPDQVSLVQSSGNQAYDESALAAARRLGYLQEPLPAGCPPDITIKFKFTP